MTSPSLTLMVQGCTSDAGKSVLVAGLGRLLARHSKLVAPFKPQNMALNSAVTSDGGEIGRAQAVQAQACNIEPHTDMNPILLKPSSDTGAQVIVQGHAISSMEATSYHDYKKVAMDAVLESHHRLSEKYQYIVVEGAGSPAEINLRDNDIANMGFAEAADCPVILIADIDRGGVFAHLIGTLKLLSQSEQDRIIGFIINRFRGDISLLDSGLKWLEQETGKPVLGVIPYLNNFYLDAEDAISVAQTLDKSNSEQLEVVVPVLSRISNHTDFDALRMHPKVNLQFTPVDAPCPPADLIILPGSKNVLQDLQKLKNAGWTDILNRHLRFGGKLMGICGGFQMLGEQLLDPEGIESKQKQICGLGFIPAETILHPEKQLKQVSGSFFPALGDLTSDQHQGPVGFTGYEIHCGITEFRTGEYQPLLELGNKKPDGVVSEEGNIIGTYVHGIFDQPSACDHILSWAGLSAPSATSLQEVRESQIERLADCLEENLDPKFVDSLLALNSSNVYLSRWMK